MDHLWGLGKAWNRVDIQTKIGNQIQESSFQNESREKCHVDFYRFENMPKCAPSPGLVKSKFYIMQPSREKTVVTVYTRISYPNLERVCDSLRDLMYLLYVILNKKHESHIRPRLEISKNQVVSFSISKYCKEIVFINENKILAMKCEILAIWSWLSH